MRIKHLNIPIIGVDPEAEIRVDAHFAKKPTKMKKIYINDDIPIPMEDLEECVFTLLTQNPMARCGYSVYHHTSRVNRTLKCTWKHLCPFKGGKEMENTIKYFRNKDSK